jgi:hypothetical protein
VDKGTSTDHFDSWSLNPRPKESREEEAWKGQGQENARMGQEIDGISMYYIVQGIWVTTGITQISFLCLGENIPQ